MYIPLVGKGTKQGTDFKRAGGVSINGILSISQSIIYLLFAPFFQIDYKKYHRLNYTWAGALSKPFRDLRGEPLDKFTMIIF